MRSLRRLRRAAACGRAGRPGRSSAVSATAARWSPKVESRREKVEEWHQLAIVALKNRTQIKTAIKNIKTKKRHLGTLVIVPSSAKIFI
jgi:hypothetical protein